MLEPEPEVHETAATHAARLGLLRIVAANATSHPPPSLNSYRTAAARAPADSAPALWYWQLTGEEWLRDSHNYELAKKAWRRMLAEHKAAEQQRDRSGRKRSADDGAQAARRSRVKREAKARDAATAYRVVDTHTYVSADGHVHILVAPSEVRRAPRTRRRHRPALLMRCVRPRYGRRPVATSSAALFIAAGTMFWTGARRPSSPRSLRATLRVCASVARRAICRRQAAAHMCSDPQRTRVAGTPAIDG